MAYGLSFVFSPWSTNIRGGPRKSHKTESLGVKSIYLDSSVDVAMIERSAKWCQSTREGKKMRLFIFASLT